jgi:hypothetical protein
MKEELTLKVVEIVTSMQNAVGKAGDFAMEQLPDIAQSYVMYGRVQSVVMLLVSLLCLAGFAFMTRWLAKNPWEGEFGEKRGITNLLSIVICVGFAIVFISVVLSNISSALLVWLAPKVWLLKEIAALIK